MSMDNSVWEEDAGTPPEEMTERLYTTIDDILCEIKGALVDIYGRPNKQFKTKDEVDEFIDDVKKILLNNLL